MPHLADRPPKGAGGVGAPGIIVVTYTPGGGAGTFDMGSTGIMAMG